MTKFIYLKTQLIIIKKSYNLNYIVFFEALFKFVFINLFKNQFFSSNKSIKKIKNPQKLFSNPLIEYFKWRIKNDFITKILSKTFRLIE